MEEFSRIKGKWDEEQNRIELGSNYFKDTLNYAYQVWEVEGRKTSSDINLYKLSVERFLQLLKAEQHLSLIVPDNLVTDLGATGLRHLIFDNYELEEFLSFENRKKIFPSVDSRYKFAVITVKKALGQSDSFKAFFYQQELDSLNDENQKLTYQLSMVKDSEPEKYSLFEPRSQKEFNLYQKIKLKFPPLRETNLINLGNDFHKTNDSQLFMNVEDSDYPLYEGKMMHQFKLLGEPVEGVSESDVIRKTGGDYEHFRIAIRAIASSTNQRSLIATLLPQNSTAANSLLVQKDVTDSMIQEQLFTLGFLNSYPIDFVLRKLVNTNINQTYLKQLPIPKIQEVEQAENIIQIVKFLLLENGDLYSELDSLIPGDSFKDVSHDELVAELNARVMLAFDLTREEVLDMMKSFETANHKEYVEEETQRIINVYDRIKLDGR